MPLPDDTNPWPALPLAAWKDTCETLHLWTQIVGKVRLKLTPWLNHSWHATLYVSARGLTTSTHAPTASAPSRSSSISSTTCCGCAPATAGRQFALGPIRWPRSTPR